MHPLLYATTQTFFTRSTHRLPGPTTPYCASFHAQHSPPSWTYHPMGLGLPPVPYPWALGIPPELWQYSYRGSGAAVHGWCQEARFDGP
eukprot:1158673-Pelagomonas_calceolata.AAC.1